ncbi:MAG TPA: hypothetical protein VNV41_07235 [Candidatus Acidoferrales bacterium]|nr:hypothetical protein [Candidatus Acidoferrales bacterium]
MGAASFPAFTNPAINGKDLACQRPVKHQGFHLRKEPQYGDYCQLLANPDDYGGWVPHNGEIRVFVVQVSIVPSYSFVPALAGRERLSSASDAGLGADAALPILRRDPNRFLGLGANRWRRLGVSGNYHAKLKNQQDLTKNVLQIHELIGKIVVAFFRLLW